MVPHHAGVGVGVDDASPGDAHGPQLRGVRLGDVPWDTDARPRGPRAPRAAARARRGLRLLQRRLERPVRDDGRHVGPRGQRIDHVAPSRHGERVEDVERLVAGAERVQLGLHGRLARRGGRLERAQHGPALGHPRRAVQLRRRAAPPTPARRAGQGRGGRGAGVGLRAQHDDEMPDRAACGVLQDAGIDRHRILARKGNHGLSARGRCGPAPQPGAGGGGIVGKRRHGQRCCQQQAESHEA